MKTKARICIALTLLISTLLSLMVSVNAASGSFDTQNFTGGSNFGGAATDTTWAARKATGTRFIIELGDQEVGGSNSYKYYVNYMQNKNQTDSALAVGSMYYGGYLGSNCYWIGGTIDTSGMTAAKQVTDFAAKTTQYVDDPPSGSGNWFNNWRTTGSINLNITESGTKFLAKVIAARALDLGDTTTYNQMRSVVEDTYSGKLAVKAEIVFSLRTPQDKQNVLITYNEFRRIGNDGSHGGGVRWARGGSETTDGAGLDKIASKLYENDSEYALKNNEVNCSCNFLGSNSFTYDGKYLCYTGYSGSETITKTNVSDRKLPNICTMAVWHSNATRYYGAGLRDVNGTTVGSNIKVNGAKPANTDWSYRCPGSDIVSNTGMKANSYLSPVIFEGWDYIYSETVVPKATYKLVEKYVDEATKNEISTAKTTPSLNELDMVDFDKKAISGYTYNRSSLPYDFIFLNFNDSEVMEFYNESTKTFTITHYYKAIPKYTVTEKYVDEATRVELLTKKTTTGVLSGTTYTVTIPSIAEYKYVKSEPTGTTHTITANTEIVHYYKSSPTAITVTERYVNESDGRDLATKKTRSIVPGTEYNVEIKEFSGYMYIKSSPTGSSFSPVANLDIIHYYRLRPEPDADVIYSVPTVTKTAQWTNTEKTEAEITITVQAQYDTSSSKKIESSDIIYIMDKSNTVGKDRLSYSKICDVISNNFKYYITGEYAGSGNRIALATFSSNLFTYDNGEKKSAVYTYTGGKNGIADWKQAQEEASLFAQLSKQGRGNFYTTVTEADNALKGLKNHWAGENTNVDLGLLYAKYLLMNRTGADANRDAYIILVTDGDPYPYTQAELERNAGGRSQDYVANKFISNIAYELKNTYGAEIFVIVLNDNDRSHDAVWENVTGEKKGGNHFKEVSATNAQQSFNNIYSQIYASMKPNITYANVAPMDLTDMINTDYFEVISTDASRTCTTNIGTTNIVNNKVYWNLGTVSYNKKCSDGQWPTLKIKIRLKDENTVGHLNTNYRLPTDDQCILTYPDGTVKKPTPWLDRESLNRTVTIKHIDDERKTTIDTETYSNILKDTYWPATGKIRNYAITNPQGQWGTRYKGYYLDTTNIVVNGTKYTSLESLPNSIFMNGDKVIEFHYKLKPAQLTIRYIEFKKKDGNLSPEFKTADGGTKEIKVEKEQSIKVTKPSNFGGKSVYTGYNLSKAGVPILSERILNNLSSPTSPIKIKLNAEDTGAHLDIIYVEENYTLTVKYQDLDGNTIKEDVHKSYPPNTSVGLDEVGFKTPIIKDGAEYKYKERDDGKGDNDSIIVDEAGKVVIFKYEVQKVPVTIRFKDKDSREEIATPQTEYVKPGETVTVDESGIPGGYIYDSRDDGKGRYEVVGPVTGTTEVIFWYVNKVPVTVRFVDAITDLDIATAQTADVKIGETLAVDYGRVPSKYAYISRTDGKPNESDSVGPVYEGTEVILYYWIEEPVEGSGLPVVSYPYLSDVKEKDGKKYVVVGESLKVSIPNRFADRHEQAESELIPLGWVKPTNGWNEEYAKVKYLVCECDVYRGNQLIPAGTPIKLDNAKGTATLELLIPEWVPEKEYKIEAIVGSEDKELTGLNYTTDTNYKENHIYNENAALGTVYITVIGRVYDFTITNLVEDKYWEGSLFDPDVDGVNYKANLNPTDPKIGVLPIGQGPNGGNTDKQQAQKYNHGIALGSTFFFNVNTLGKKNQTVSIKPTFKYVPIDSTEVKDVDLYIETEDGKYENILETDGQVIQTQLNNDYKKENTSLGLEMSYAFGIGNGVVEFKDLKTNASYDLVTGSRLRLDKDNARVPFKEYFEEEGITRYAEGSKEYDEVLASACHWYGEYRIPSSTKVMAKGEEPGKGTEYKNGFIIVLFEIITQDVDDETVPHDDATHRYLIYNEQISGDQWDNEGGAAHGETMKLTMPRLTGVGTKEVNLTVANGTYPVAIYDVAVRANGKYEAAGTH